MYLLVRISYCVSRYFNGIQFKLNKLSKKKKNIKLAVIKLLTKL